MTRRLGILALFGALLGCTSAAEPDYATLDVELSYLERIALPPGAMAVAAIHLTDAKGYLQGVPLLAPTAGPDAIVARETVEIVGAVPVTIKLRFDRRALDPARAPVVDGWIFAGDQVLFTLPAPSFIQPRLGATARLTLRRPHRIPYLCDDKSRLSVAFPFMGSLAFLESTGATPVALRAQPVGSGFHFGGNGFDLRGKGAEAILKRPAGGETRCVASRP